MTIEDMVVTIVSKFWTKYTHSLKFNAIRRDEFKKSKEFKLH